MTRASASPGASAERTLSLGRTFDAVTCLFSAIGFVGNPDGLQAAAAALGAHLASGGVLLVEPWLVRERNPHATTLLDAACGTGKHLEHLRHDFACEGVDLDDGLLEVARARLPGLPLQQGDMRTILAIVSASPA